MADLFADRVVAVFQGHLEGKMSDREFSQSIAEFTAEELNELVRLVNVLPPRSLAKE